MYQVLAPCQVFYQAQCWLRSTGLAKQLGLCVWEAPGVPEAIPSQWQNAINNSHRLLRGLTAGGLTWFAQCGKLLDVTKSPGKQVGLELLKAACGPTCKGTLEEASGCSVCIA